MTTDNTAELPLSEKLMVYIPAYNCAEYIVKVIDEIPDRIWDIADIVVVDNCSQDNTVKNIQQARYEQRWSKEIHLIQPGHNLGYAGSQKLIYSIAGNAQITQHVIMLHRDGQYPPQLLEEFTPYTDSDYDLIYGFRDKSSFPDKEETPFVTYMIVKTLSVFESLVTGHRRKEWHTGFVMYSKKFLQQINLDDLTDTYHIDGHLQFAAGEIGAKIKAIPIWKRYKDYEQLRGLNRFTYIGHVLRLMVQFRVKGFSKTTKEAKYPYTQFSIIKDSGPKDQ